MDEQGFCIGNGTSREAYDLTRLHGGGVSIGCNRLYLDFHPDYMVAIDDEPVAQITEFLNDHPGAFRFITRNMDHEPGERWGRHLMVDGVETMQCKDLNSGHSNNSGIMAAAYLSEVFRLKRVYLIGVDFFRPTPSRRNDVYGEYFGYSTGITDAWNMLTRNNPQTQFIRVGPIEKADVEFYNTDLFGFWLIETFDEFEQHAGLKSK